MRIVLFVGSPLEVDKVEMEKLAKKLKKEKVNVDIVSFGDHQKNNDVLTGFINTLNGKDGTGSHLVSVPRGSQLQEALISSPIIQGEDGTGPGIGGAGFEFGVDPNEDPELALALRVSMEEQRQRQEDEQRRAQAASAQETTGESVPAVSAVAPTSDEAMLERALALSTETPVKRLRVRFALDFGFFSLICSFLLNLLLDF
jgi:26S proteasome regulatory subunit N10